MSKGLTIKQVADLMMVSTTKIWYDIKKSKKIKKVYLAECGHCYMVDREEIMKILKEMDKKERIKLAKKEALLKKEAS